MPVALAALVLLAALAFAAPARAAVPILLYHQIAPAPEDARNPRLYVTPGLFEGHVRALERAGYTGVTLARVREAWRPGGRPLPRRPVVLSFDDGYASQYAAAGPVLRRAGWPGVLCLTERFVGARGGLTSARVKVLLRRGWELAGHTRTHPDLTAADDATLAAELDPRGLERRFGRHIGTFCYPYGRSDERVRAAVRAAGYELGLTARRGLARPGDDPFALARIGVPGGTSPNRLLRLLAPASRRAPLRSAR